MSSVGQDSMSQGSLNQDVVNQQNAGRSDQGVSRTRRFRLLSRWQERVPTDGHWRQFVEPGLIIVIGIALGLVDQAASEVSGLLRVPALVGALVLVGQGLNLIEQIVSAESAEDAESERNPGAGQELEVSNPGGARHRTYPRPNESVEEDSGGRSNTLAWMTLALAIWLGLATLAFPTAPLPLILLSLLTAYLLFAKGWRVMMTR